MNPDADSPTLDGCEAFQRQLSEAADAGAPLTSEIQAHLQSCANCAAFAEVWLPKGPVALSGFMTMADDDRLRERLLEAASRSEIIPFPGAAEHRAGWIAWARRIAACLAVTGLAWWLLNPMPSPVKTRKAAVADPTLAQSLARMEDRTKHEQQILRTALADGGQHVRGDVEWTLSALEP